MTNFNERIAELAELEKHVLPLNWETSGALNENIVDSRNMFVAETNSDDEAAFIVALRNEALPLLREMQQALNEAQAERDALQKRVDGALNFMIYRQEYSDIARKVIKILTGEGE